MQQYTIAQLCGHMHGMQNPYFVCSMENLNATEIRCTHPGLFPKNASQTYQCYWGTNSKHAHLFGNYFLLEKEIDVIV